MRSPGHLRLTPAGEALFPHALAAVALRVVLAAAYPGPLSGRGLDPVQLDTARSFGIGPLQRLLRVTLPSAVPYIATGLRIASATALILAVTAELIIGSAGLGLSINVAREGGAVELMYALSVPTGSCRRGQRPYRRLCEVNLPQPRDQVETKELPDFAHVRAQVNTAIKRTKPVAEREPA